MLRQTKITLLPLRPWSCSSSDSVWLASSIEAVMVDHLRASRQALHSTSVKRKPPAVR